MTWLNCFRDFLTEILFMQLVRTRVVSLALHTLLFLAVVLIGVSTQFKTVFSDLSRDYLLASFWFFDQFYLDFLIFFLI